MLLPSAKCSRPLCRWDGEPFKGAIIPFGAIVEYHRISAKDQSRLYQFGEKVLPGIFIGCALVSVRIWREDVLVEDIEELGTLDASEARRLNAKEIVTSQKGEDLIFPFADGVRESTVRQCQLVGSEDLSQELQRNSDGS